MRIPFFLEDPIEKQIRETLKFDKRFRADYGDFYFFLNKNFKIDLAIDTRDMNDQRRYDCLNYFQTEEQARKAASAISGLLRKLHELFVK